MEQQQQQRRRPTTDLLVAASLQCLEVYLVGLLLLRLQVLLLLLRTSILILWTLFEKGGRSPGADQG